MRLRCVFVYAWRVFYHAGRFDPASGARRRGAHTSAPRRRVLRAAAVRLRRPRWRRQRRCSSGRGGGGSGGGETKACTDAFVSLSPLPTETMACTHTFVSSASLGDTKACMHAIVSPRSLSSEMMASMHAIVSPGFSRVFIRYSSGETMACTYAIVSSGRALCETKACTDAFVSRMRGGDGPACDGPAGAGPLALCLAHAGDGPAKSRVHLVNAALSHACGGRADGFRAQLPNGFSLAREGRSPPIRRRGASDRLFSRARDGPWPGRPRPGPAARVRTHGDAAEPAWRCRGARASAPRRGSGRPSARRGSRV